jgi:predicted transcriptional regulator
MYIDLSFSNRPRNVWVLCYNKGIVSQSLIANLVVDKFSKFARGPEKGTWALGFKSVEDLGLIKKDIISVQQSDLVIDALYHMHQSCVSSIAIMGTLGPDQVHNKIFGTISMSDIKEILATKKGWNMLMMYLHLT